MKPINPKFKIVLVAILITKVAVIIYGFRLDQIKKVSESKTTTIKNKDFINDVVTSQLKKVDIDRDSQKINFKYDLLLTRQNIIKFHHLHHKALLSVTEKNDLYDLISKPEVLESTARYLSSTTDSDLFDDHVKPRLAAVDLLSTALRSSNGPQLELVSKKIEAVLKMNWIQSDLPATQKHILVGDQMELFHALELNAPDQSKIFLSQNLSPAQLRLYNLKFMKSERINNSNEI